MRSAPDRRKPRLLTRAATNLRELHQTLLDEPLGPDEWDLYEAAMARARGEDVVRTLTNELREAKGGMFVKRFFSGSRAAGKSTEITRLVKGISDDFEVVRIDIRDWISTTSIEPQDLLLAIVFAMTDAFDEARRRYDIQVEPDAELVRELDALAQEIEYVSKREKKGEVEVGIAGLKALGLAFRGKAQVSHTFEESVRRKQRECLSRLVSLANRFLAECYDMLWHTDQQKEWLIVVEELDKSLNLSKLTATLKEEALWHGIEANIICNIPAAAKVGETLSLRQCTIYDVPVWRPASAVRYELFDDGVNAVEHAILKRADGNLFAPNQLRRLIVASGGNLRTLFRMVDHAGRLARIRLEDAGVPDATAGPIEVQDVTYAILTMRAEYRDRMGESMFEEDQPTTDDKLARLKEVYVSVPGHDVNDRVLSFLMRAGAVQLFNQTVRYAVHPLVVDLMVSWTLVEPNPQGVPGGLLPAE